MLPPDYQKNNQPTIKIDLYKFKKQNLESSLKNISSCHKKEEKPKPIETNILGDNAEKDIQTMNQSPFLENQVVNTLEKDDVNTVMYLEKNKYCQSDACEKQMNEESKEDETKTQKKLLPEQAIPEKDQQRHKKQKMSHELSDFKTKSVKVKLRIGKKRQRRNQRHHNVPTKPAQSTSTQHSNQIPPVFYLPAPMYGWYPIMPFSFSHPYPYHQKK